MARDTRTTLLDLAIASIEEGGEASIRVNHLAAAAGVTPPVVYHYFGSRDGLVVAAQTERYTRQIRADFAGFIHAVEGCGSAEDLRAVLVASWNTTLSGRSASRWLRLNALGSAYARPDLQAAITRAQDELFRTAANALEPCQTRGWIRADIDLTAAVAWQHGVQLSRGILEHGTEAVDLDAWDRISLEAFLNLAFGPPGASSGDSGPDGRRATGRARGRAPRVQA